MAQGGKIDLRSLLQIAKRWKWLLIMPPILALIGAYAYVTTSPMLYTSSTTIILNSNQAASTTLREMPGMQPQRQLRMVDIGENIRQQLLAESTLNKVLDRAGIEPTQGMLNRAKEMLQTQTGASEQEILRRLQLEWLAQKVEASLTFPKCGQYIQLSLAHTNPDQAYKLTKYLAEVFIEESLNVEGVRPQEVLEFANAQLEKYAKKLEEAREHLRQFKTDVVREQTRSFDVNVQNEAQINSQIKLLLEQVQSNVATYEEIVKTFEAQIRSAKIGDTLRRSDTGARYSISAPAIRPITPDTTGHHKILLMAFFGGLGFGISLVYLIEFFDNSFKSVEEVEKFLEITVLGTVPKLDFGEK